MLNAGIKTSHFRKIVYGIEQGYIMIYEHILIVVTAHTNNIIFGIVQNSAAKKTHLLRPAFSHRTRPWSTEKTLQREHHLVDSAFLRSHIG